MDVITIAKPSGVWFSLLVWQGVTQIVKFQYRRDSKRAANSNKPMKHCGFATASGASATSFPALPELVVDTGVWCWLSAIPIHYGAQTGTVSGFKAFDHHIYCFTHGNLQMYLSNIRKNSQWNVSIGQLLHFQLTQCFCLLCCFDQNCWKNKHPKVQLVQGLDDQPAPSLLEWVWPSTRDKFHAAISHGVPRHFLLAPMSRRWVVFFSCLASTEMTQFFWLVCSVCLFFVPKKCVEPKNTLRSKVCAERDEKCQIGRKGHLRSMVPRKMLLFIFFVIFLMKNWQTMQLQKIRCQQYLQPAMLRQQSLLSSWLFILNFVANWTSFKVHVLIQVLIGYALFSKSSFFHLDVKTGCSLQQYFNIGNTKHHVFGMFEYSSHLARCYSRFISFLLPLARSICSLRHPPWM